MTDQSEDDAATPAPAAPAATASPEAGPCRPELVLSRLEAGSWQEVLTAMAELAERSGFGAPTLRDALLAREETSPTGLPTVIPVAIPHADAEHVRRFGLAVALLDRPVRFGEMGTDDNQVDVRAVFMPLIPDADKQVGFLMSMIGMLKDGSWADAIQDQDPNTIADRVNDLLGQQGAG
jgi:PTS system galactitol-specific IIA component